MKRVDGIPNFEHINIEIGLKFLNSNVGLYLKILNSFLTRYEHIDIASLTHDELKDVVHTIKGLSATLGMEKLNILCNGDLTEESIRELRYHLSLVIDELNKELKTL